MPAEPIIEQRLAALEAAVKELQSRLPAPAPNWLDQVIGPVTDDEAFRQVLEYGRAYRDADRPPDEAGESS